MIQGFADKVCERFFQEGVCPSQWKAFENVAKRKLDMVDAATRLNDLRSPPGNGLEALRGDREGHHSIRINDQYRVCFRWTDAGPTDVEIVDYH
jgi:proteic killer suppression protein